MGNCTHKGVVTTKHSNPIRIMMDSGRVLEFEAPKFAREVTVDYPGYGIFGQGSMALPMLDLAQLNAGQFYYLLPIGQENKPRDSSQTGIVTQNFAKRSGLEVLAPLKRGVWKVKLVIGSKELEEILSEQLNTEALIEQMSMAAKSSTPRKSYCAGNLRPILSTVFKNSLEVGTSFPSVIRKIEVVELQS